MGNNKANPKSVAPAGRRFVIGNGIIARAFGSGARKFLDIFEGRIIFGNLTIRFPDQQQHVIRGRESGPDGVMEIRDWRALSTLIAGGALGFADAYLAGRWDSPNLVKLIELGSLNRHTLGQSLRGKRLVRGWNRLVHLRRNNTRRGANRNIHFHYDLGNDFYDKWLDPTMSYSSAIFAPGDNSLERAQIGKYRRICESLDLQPGQHVLEIGCGWGGFSEIAAREFGAKVTGISLSDEQLVYARDRIERAGLDGQVALHRRDYRDTEGLYDHIVSIEMFEAVGEQHWRKYFNKIFELLKPGGRAALQIICIDDALFDAYRKGTDFIQAHIFPGGMLGAVKPIRQHVKNAGLDWDDFRSYGQDYAKTLAEWRSRFEAAFRDGRLPERFDEHFRKVWSYYLSYCEGGFRGGGLDVIQLALERPKGPGRGTT